METPPTKSETRPTRHTMTQEKRYLSDIIYGLFVKGRKLPMLTFETEEDAEQRSKCDRWRDSWEFEIVPLSEVLRFTPEAIKALNDAYTQSEKSTTA